VGECVATGVGAAGFVCFLTHYAYRAAGVAMMLSVLFTAVAVNQEQEKYGLQLWLLAGMMVTEGCTAWISKSMLC
jgi:hypothetical protein